MILFKTKPQRAPTSEYKSCTALHRWILELYSIDYTYFGLHWCLQTKIKESAKWSSSHSISYGFDVNLNPLRWSFGFVHCYYDGPHCLFNFGPFQIQYNGKKWCTLCAGE